MNPSMKVPFVDLLALHLELEQELIAVVRNVLQSGGFIGGPLVEGFERDFGQLCAVQHCIGVGSGTDALRFALMAAGVEPGSIVITVPNTFIATTEAISQAGLLPEFVDIDERTYNMSVEALRKYLEQRCRRDASGRLVSLRNRKPVSAILPVHLYGQMADMDGILELAELHNLVVVEDACQAHGAQYYSQKHERWFTAGSMGRAAAFSFYPGKNLGACGEAGAVTTNDPSIAARVRMLRDHGQAKKYYHEMEGYNGRLDAIQAGMLQVKASRLWEWNRQRRERAAEYKQLFESSGASFGLPFEPPWSRAVYHLYVVRAENRDRLICFLKENGITAGIHYPIPLHLQRAYRSLGYREGDFPVAEKAAAEIISLPMYPQLTSAQQTWVVDKCTSFVAEPACAPLA